MKSLFQTRYPKQVGGCFIAGTLVHTDKGLVPIEQIKVGDRVLSQPEQGGEITYKAVVNTFVFEEKEIFVIKFNDWDGKPSPNIAIHHLYATGNHPFWVDGTGWTAAENLRIGNRLQLADGRTVEVDQVWPVLRTPTYGVGWVSADTLGNYDGLERAHIVDFRNGCNLWTYPMMRRQEAGVPYREQFCFDDIEGLFSSAAMAEVFYGDDRSFKASAFNLEVDGNHTYFVGELGVWVHNRNCFSLELLYGKQSGKR